MKITGIRTRVVSWHGKTVALPPHFCTNPMDLLDLPQASMSTFTFHGWLVVEIFADDGSLGIGNHCIADEIRSLDGLWGWCEKVRRIPEFFIRQAVASAADPSFGHWPNATPVLR